MSMSLSLSLEVGGSFAVIDPYGRGVIHAKATLRNESIAEPAVASAAGIGFQVFGPNGAQVLLERAHPPAPDSRYVAPGESAILEVDLVVAAECVEANVEYRLKVVLFDDMNNQADVGFTFHHVYLGGLTGKQDQG